MTRFYAIEHLSTNELRELYYTYAPFGEVIVEYIFKEMPPGIVPLELSEAEIIRNIDAKIGNFCSREIDDDVDDVDDCYAGVEDKITLGFNLLNYDGFSVFVHLPFNLRDGLIKKYKMYEHWDD